MDVKVSRMPAAVFSRAIPNVETNVRVMGLTFHDKAIYFLPENIMVTDGGGVRYAEYSTFQIAPDIFDVHDTERRAYKDAECVGYAYRIRTRTVALTAAMRSTLGTSRSIDLGVSLCG